MSVVSIDDVGQRLIRDFLLGLEGACNAVLLGGQTVVNQNGQAEIAKISQVVNVISNDVVHHSGRIGIPGSLELGGDLKEDGGHLYYTQWNIFCQGVPSK